MASILSTSACTIPMLSSKDAERFGERFQVWPMTNPTASCRPVGVILYYAIKNTVNGYKQRKQLQHEF